LTKVLITPRSFGKGSHAAYDLLDEAGLTIVPNPFGRILTEDEMLQAVKEVDALIVGVDPVTARVLDEACRLRVISKYGVGLDNIDLDYAEAKGIPVTITQGANTEAVADYTFALMLAAARKVIPIDSGCRRLDWGKTMSLGVYGKTLGILGTGAVGKAVIKRARGFGMRILGYDLLPDYDFANLMEVKYADADQIFREADFISIHLPATEETRGLIGREQFRMMKGTAVVINTARGGIIDEIALFEALSDNRIWGAGLDVFNQEPPEGSPLLSLDNLVIGSHCAASTFDAVDNMSLLAARNVAEVLKSGLR